MRKRLLTVLLVLGLTVNPLPANVLAAENEAEMQVGESLSDGEDGDNAVDIQGKSAADALGGNLEIDVSDPDKVYESQGEDPVIDGVEMDEVFGIQGEGSEVDIPEEQVPDGGDSLEIVDSGTCGESVFWTLDSEGTLEISGTGEMADYGYDHAAPWSSGQKEIEKILIQSGVTSIGYGAFYGCSSLTSVEIPSSVTSIGWYAFLTGTGYGAFAGCSSLTSVEIPSSVTSIGWSAFAECSSLTSVEIPSSVTSIQGCVFDGCSSLKSVKIPSSMTGIGWFMFAECSSLTSVEIPSSVTSIGEGAFFKCSGLTRVEIPSSVTRIGDRAFFECSSLTSVEIPSSVTNIGDNVFFKCSSLTDIIIPSSVTRIGGGAFDSCNNLKDVYYSGSEDQWKVIEIGEDNTCLQNANIHFNSTGPEGGDIVVDPDDTLIVTKNVELNKSEEFEFPFTFHEKEFDSELLAAVVQDESIVSAFIKDLEVIDEGYEGFEISKKISGVLVLTGVDAGDTEVLLGYPGGAVAYKFKVSVSSTGSGGDITVDPDKIIISGNGSIRVGETVELSAEIIYNTIHNDDSIEWTSSNSTVVAFDGDKGSVTNPIETISNGKATDTVQIHALSVGRANIICRSASGATQIFKVVVQAGEGETTKLQEFVKKWRTAYDAYIGALEEALKKKSNEISKVTIDEQAEALMEADAKSSSKLVVFNGQHDETVRMNVYKAVANFLADNTAQSINLGNISVSGVNVTSIAASIVNSIYKAMDTKSYTYKYGNATIRIEGCSFSGASARKISYESGKVKSGFVAQLTSTQKQAMKAVTAYLNELVKLEKNVISEAYSQMAKSVFGKDINGLVKDKVSKIIKPYVDAIVNTGLGKVDVAMNTCLNYYSYAKKIMNMGSQNPAELVKSLSSMKTFTFEDTSIKDKFVKSTMKGLEKAKKELNEAFEAYINTGKVDAGSSIGNWFKETFTGIKDIFKCPVDIAVYDSTGEQVGFVGEGEIWYKEDILYIEQYGDTKTIYSNNADLNFEIIGTDYGFLNCTFEEWANGVAIGRVNYYDIPLYDGKSLSASAPGRNVTTETVIVTDHDTGVVPADESISFEEYDTAVVHINCVASGAGGQVYGTGDYVRGDAVNVHAAEEEGYVFFGWQNSDGALESTSNIYEFTARENITLTALFAEYIEDSGDIPDIYIITFDANGGAGAMDDVIVEKGENFTFPACGFTEPEGHKFKAWKIGDREFAPGDNYIVEEDTIVSAYWIEEAVPTPDTDPTMTPEPGQTPTPEPSSIPTPEPPVNETPKPSEAPTSEPPVSETPKPSEAPTPEPIVTGTPEPSPVPTSEPAITETPEPGSASTPEPVQTPEPVEVPTEMPTTPPESGADQTPTATMTPNPSQIPPLEPDAGSSNSGTTTDSSSEDGSASSVSDQSDNGGNRTESPKTGDDNYILWLIILMLITGGLTAAVKVAEVLKAKE